MSFFQKLGTALSRFMYGRNGSDQLGWASLVLLLVLAVLWIAKPAVFGLICRYAIIMLLGFSMTLNGLAGYRKSRWAGFFLMAFGTILFLGNLFMLASQFAA